VVGVAVRVALLIGERGPRQIDEAHRRADLVGDVQRLPFGRVLAEGVECATPLPIGLGLNITVDRNRQCVRQAQFVEPFVEVGWAFDQHGGGPQAQRKVAYKPRACGAVVAHWHKDNRLIEIEQGCVHAFDG